jgi:hypothetical protein
MSIRINSPDSGQTAGEDDLGPIASRAIAAIVEEGAGILAAQPWRVGRIIGGAEAMTIDELAARIVSRGVAGAPADFNRALALAQLGLALKSPRFRAAWADWRAGALCE